MFLRYVTGYFSFNFVANSLLISFAKAYFSARHIVYICIIYMNNNIYIIY